MVLPTTTYKPAVALANGDLSVILEPVQFLSRALGRKTAIVGTSRLLVLTSPDQVEVGLPDSPSTKSVASLRFSIRKSVLSHDFTTEHFNPDRVVWTRLATSGPKTARIQANFHDERGTSSCPPKSLAICSAILTISGLCG